MKEIFMLLIIAGGADKQPSVETFPAVFEKIEHCRDTARETMKLMKDDIKFVCFPAHQILRE